jgi:hypothetical protein
MIIYLSSSNVLFPTQRTYCQAEKYYKVHFLEQLATPITLLEPILLLT